MPTVTIVYQAKQLLLEVQPHESLFMLKRKIESVIFIPLLKQRLFHQGKELVFDGRILAEYHMDLSHMVNLDLLVDDTNSGCTL